MPDRQETTTHRATSADPSKIVRARRGPASRHRPRARSRRSCTVKDAAPSCYRANCTLAIVASVYRKASFEVRGRSFRNYEPPITPASFLSQVPLFSRLALLLINNADQDAFTYVTADSYRRQASQPMCLPAYIASKIVNGSRTPPDFLKFWSLRIIDWVTCWPFEARSTS